MMEGQLQRTRSQLRARSHSSPGGPAALAAPSPAPARLLYPRCPPAACTSLRDVHGIYHYVLRVRTYARWLWFIQISHSIYTRAAGQQRAARRSQATIRTGPGELSDAVAVAFGMPRKLIAPSMTPSDWIVCLHAVGYQKQCRHLCCATTTVMRPQPRSEAAVCTHAPLDRNAFCLRSDKKRKHCARIHARDQPGSRGQN